MPALAAGIHALATVATSVPIALVCNTRCVGNHIIDGTAISDRAKAWMPGASAGHDVERTSRIYPFLNVRLT
jgi:hypothetical protein